LIENHALIPESTKFKNPFKKEKLMLILTNPQIIGLEEHFFNSDERFTTITCKSLTGSYMKMKKEDFFKKVKDELQIETLW